MEIIVGQPCHSGKRQLTSMGCPASCCLPTGRGSQWAGEGEVVTITADPLDLSLCTSCMAAVLATGSGIRSAIVKRWRRVNRRAAAQQAGRRAELERQARADLERVASKGDGNGRDG